MATIRVKCPNCGKVLKINEELASKSTKMKCPVCGLINPIASFEPYVPPVSHVNGEEDNTQIAGSRNDTSGYFFDERTYLKYPIPDGKKSLFGRKSIQSESKADVPVDVNYPEGLDLGISRQHFWVESVMSSDGKYHVYISNAQNKNKTYINGSVLEDGDAIGLNEGDKVSCSKMVLRYEKPESQASASSRKIAFEDDDEGTLI